MRSTTSVFAVCALALGLTLSPLSPAIAHARLIQAAPAIDGVISAPPAEIRLTFSEALEPKFCAVALSAQDGAIEPLGAPSVDPANAGILIASVKSPLAPGVYKVTWRVVSTDTHRTQGSFSFTLKP